jgi:hypothetical protein
VGQNAVAGFHLLKDLARRKMMRLFFELAIMFSLFQGTR